MTVRTKSRARVLMDAAEATVMMHDPADRQFVIVGFRVDKSKCPLASLIGAFNEMVDLAESADGEPLDAGEKR